MAETKALKAKNNEGGVFTAQLLAAEVSTAHVNPVPEKAPGVITAEPGTAKEEHIYYREKDAVAGTISGLVRDYTNLNGGVGQTHENNEDWETLQATEYLNNLVDILQQGWQEEMLSPTYASATTFTVKGNLTTIYSKGRILRFNEDNTKIAIVASSSYSGGTGLTTVTITYGTVPNPITECERDMRPQGMTDIEFAFYTDDTGTANTYGATISPAPTRLMVGMKVVIKVANANSGASTFNLNGLGAVDIKKQGTQALASGDINAGQLVPLQYDGTYWQIVGGGGGSSSNSYVLEDLTRSSSTVTLSNTPIAGTLALFRDGQLLKEGSGNDYTRSGSTVTLADAVGTNFQASYWVAAVSSSNADTVDNFHASATPTANQIPVLNSSAKIPESTLPQDGWLSANETWTYASANTITVPSGAANKYGKGDKIRLKQGGSYKYFYIIGVADTVLTVTGGSDYTVANSAITDNYYSHQMNPFGFTMEFACASPTWNTNEVDNGTGGQQPTAGTNKFMIIGNKLYLRGAWGNTNVKKNGAGSIISTTALPATLPASAAFFNLPCGISNPAGVNAIVTDRSAGEFRISANSSIPDNTDMTYSGYTFEYFF